MGHSIFTLQAPFFVASFLSVLMIFFDFFKIIVLSFNIVGHCITEIQVQGERVGTEWTVWLFTTFFLLFLINRSKIHRLQICLFVRLINTYPRKHYVGKIKVGTMSDWSNSPNWIRICMGQAGAAALDFWFPRNAFDTVQILEEAAFLTVTKGNRTSKSIKLYSYNILSFTKVWLLML